MHVLHSPLPLCHTGRFVGLVSSILTCSPNNPLFNNHNPQGICYAFKSGNCNYGDTCRFDHPA